MNLPQIPTPRLRIRLAMWLALTASSGAANLTWDADLGTGGAQDGTGAWNLANSNWFDGNGNLPWSNGAPVSDAVFGTGTGTAGVVTLGTGITVGSLTFNAAAGNYTIAAGTLTLTGAGIAVNDDAATINSVLAGNVAFAKTGSGTLVLGGNNTFSGALSVLGGTLSIATVNADSSNGVLGNSALPVTLGGVGISATLEYTGTTTVSTKKFALATGGTGIFQIDQAAATLQLSGLMSGGGGLTKIGPGALRLDNGANTFSGAVLVSDGKLQYNTSNVIGGGPVTVDGATAVLDIGGASDTFGTLTVDHGGTILGFGGLTSTGSFEMKSGSVSAALNGSGVVLNKTTAGTVTLSGSNGYTGATMITAGVLALANSNILPNNSVISVIGSTASLVMGSAHNDDVGSLIVDDNGAVTGSGGSTLTVNTPGTYDLRSGAISANLAGNAPLNKTTPGIVTLSGTNTYSGFTTISQGKILYGANDALGGNDVSIVGAAAILDLGVSHTDSVGIVTLDGGSILGTGSSALSSNFFNVHSGTVTAGLAGGGSLTKTTAGTVILSGQNTYSGDTNMNAGTLHLDFSAAGAPVANIINSSANNSSLKLGGGIVQITGAAGATNSQRFNNTTLLTNAGSALRVVQNGASTLNVTLGGLARNPQSTIDFTLPTTGTITTSTTTNSGAASGNVMTDNGVSYATISGTDWATNVSGTIGRLGSYASDNFSAATNNVDVTVDASPAAFTVHTLRFNTPGRTLTLATGGAAAPSTVGAGGILVTPATLGAGNGVVIAAGGANALLRGNPGRELVIANYGQLDVNVPIVENGGTPVTIAGNGFLTFNAANTYTGAVVIQGGTLKINTLTGLGSSAGGVVVNESATLDLAVAGTINNESMTLNGSLLVEQTGTWSGTVTINAPATIQVTAGATWTRTSSTGFNVNAPLIKTGDGALAFVSVSPSGNTGSLTVAAGAVTVDGNSNWNGGNVTIASGGTFRVFGVGANSIGDARTVTVQPGGVFDFQQTQGESLGGTFLNGTGLGGTGALVNSAAVTTGGLGSGLTLQSDSAIGVTQPTGNLNISGIVTGAFTLTKVGPGTLTFNGNQSTMTGNIVVSAGTLVASLAAPADGSIGTLGRANLGSRSITIASGATLSFTGNDIFGQVATNPAPVIIVNGGTLASTRYNAIGDLTLNGGTLSQSSSDSGSFQGYQFRGAVIVGGTAPSTISTGNGRSNHLGANTTFTVADVTGNSDPDLLVSAPFTNQSSNFGSAAGGFTKAGPGTMALAGSHTYTGNTTILEGRLLVNGQLAAGSLVKVAGLAILSGSGSVGSISANTVGTDAGLLSPGTLDGILSATTVQGATGLDFAFEMKQAIPAFGSASASGNDVLHLTSATPFAGGPLNSSNAISVYFDHPNDSYRGGLFAFDGQLNPDTLLLNAVSGASFNYFLKSPAGGVIFNGDTYVSLSSNVVSLASFTETANFSAGTVTGGELQFAVIPEPAAATLLLGGWLLLGARRRRS